AGQREAEDLPDLFGVVDHQDLLCFHKDAPHVVFLRATVPGRRPSSFRIESRRSGPSVIWAGSIRSRITSEASPISIETGGCSEPITERAGGAPSSFPASRRLRRRRRLRRSSSDWISFRSTEM